MAVAIKMPALSPTMTQGNIVRWLVKEGDRVETGDVLLEIETDKATMEVEAADDGVVGQIVEDQGKQDVPVNSVLAWLLAEGESAEDISVDMKQSESLAPDHAQENSNNGHVNGGVANGATSSEGESGSGESGSEKSGTEGSSPGAPMIVKAVGNSVDGVHHNGVHHNGVHHDESEWQGATMKAQVREAIRDALAEEMERDERVFIMGEEVAEYQGAYKATQGLLERFGPKRVIDTPISEYGFAGIGVGAAFGGLRPVVEFMTFNFAMQAIDHIIGAGKLLYMSGGQIAVPIVFRGPNGRAAQVAAQHSQCYASWYAHVPGLKVVAPFCSADAKGLLKAAVRDNNPVIVLEHELLYGRVDDVPDSGSDPSAIDHTLAIGKARIRRQGKDVTLISYSHQLITVLEAAERLAQEGIDAEVIDLRSLRPFDSETIKLSVQKTNRVVVVEEGWGFAGIGSEVAAMVMEQAFDYLDAPVKRLSAPDVPMPYSAPLESLVLIHTADIVGAAKEVCYSS